MDAATAVIVSTPSTSPTQSSRRKTVAAHPGGSLSGFLQSFLFRAGSGALGLVLGVDVLAPEGYGEIVGGGQRIHDPELLLKRIEEHKLPKEAFNWYIDLRKYGTVPHAGFGMGIERCVAWICGLEHIRETIAFPRMLNRLHP